MMADLMINGKDAFEAWGVRMGEEFVGNLLSPAGLKDFIENESGLEHGKRMLVVSPRLADREVSLNFTIEGVSAADYLQKHSAFVTELQKGEVQISLPLVDSSVYKLVYQRSASFAMNVERTFSRLAVKFCEPNPADRE